MSEFDSNSYEDRPSKSQRKRDMTALQKLGETLVKLSEAQLAKIPLNGRLLDAIQAARSLKSHEAIRRQMQYIGKLMRDEDAEPIAQALEKIQLQDQQGKAQFHQIERWREKLIAEGDKLLEEFLNQYSNTDRQHLRQLIRNAQQNKSGAEKELFRYLREIIEKK